MFTLLNYSSEKTSLSLFFYFSQNSNTFTPRTKLRGSNGYSNVPEQRSCEASFQKSVLNDEAQLFIKLKNGNFLLILIL